MNQNENITPHRTSVAQHERMKITGSRPAVYWMSGLSGSGKSTVAAIFEKKMTDAGHACFMIDGDTVRTGLCAGLGFSPEGRRENLRRIAELAKIVASSGQTVVVCTISPDRQSRDNARRIIAPYADFREVYVKADVALCASRDPKGLYKKAFAGEIPDFTGVSAPYEVPESPEIVLDTAEHTADECAELLYREAVAGIYQPETLIRGMIDAAFAASAKIMEIYDGEYEVSFKDDKSPLTTADTASNAILTAMFREKFPEYSILSEEETDSTERLSNNAGVFIIDPIDGTKEFIHRNGEFCVSIGFASRHRVTAGVIAVPAKSLIYYACENCGAYRIGFDEITADFSIGAGVKLQVSDRTEKVIIAASRSHMDGQTEQIFAKNEARILDSVTAGSCLKGCMIAEGRADVHYRYGAFMKEWDTAAMEIICREAGAIFTDIDGKPLIANRADPVNRRGFMILNHPGSALDTSGIE
ncbi:MAG: adenylyl-sulfate kinase [Clostridia bacterium]|nr:adenylyl-sulfate kinase [Clostridia bacterium]